MAYKILTTWDPTPFPGILDPLAEVGELTIAAPDQMLLVQMIKDYDVYLTSLRTRVDREVLDNATRLKLIVTPSTGTDHIDMEDAARRGITVLSNKEEYGMLKQITATAEMAWCLLLSAARKLPPAVEAAKQGFWGRDTFRGRQIAYRSLGILGYGRLGEMVADYGKAFRMKVLACDVKDFEADGVERVDFETLLRESDVLSIHIHLTPETEGLIGAAEFAMMKPGCILVNTSRGAILDEKAFLQALERGPLEAAGVDVIHGEWDPSLYNHPLVVYARTHDNLIISPHLGGGTYESQRMARSFTVEKLVSYLKRGPQPA